MSNHEEGITSEEYFARLDAGIPYEGPVIGLGYAIKEIVVTPIPINDSETETYWLLNTINILVNHPIEKETLNEEENLYVFKRNNYVEHISEEEYESYRQKAAEIALKTGNLLIGGVSTYYTYKGDYMLNTELWRYQKTNKRFITRFTKTDKGKYVWDSGGEVRWRKVQLNNLKPIREIGKKITFVGGAMVALDVGLSREIRTSHLISGGMIIISFTGVGALIASIYFIADFGTMGANYLIKNELKGIGDIIDDNTSPIKKW